MSDTKKYLLPAGTTAHDVFESDVDIARAGWDYSSLKVVALDAAGSVTIPASQTEYLVLPLNGSCVVTGEGIDFPLEGRESVWTDITDYAYIPRDTEVTISSAAGGRFALPGAVADSDFPARYCPRSEVDVSVRGAGPASRQVNNYALGNDVKTSRLLACEVLTPGGNWSSYPPHKHDEENENEQILEEIYYYQVQASPAGDPGFGFQRIYATPAGDIDVTAEIRDRDLIVMPFGYHGPSIAAPGYDLYYLNVMAGPAEGAQWLSTDDPQHAWIRDSWASQTPDPRLPMTATE